MKHSCLLLCLAFCTSAFAESPTGFAEIPFGTPLKEAQAKLASREGLKAEDANANRLVFSGGTFAGQQVSRWTLVFAADKLASGSILIEKVKKPVYDDLKAQLTKKYGKPDSEEGHHSFDCIWEFRSNGRRKVHLNYDYREKVILTYSHGALLAAAPGEGDL